jgi:hypothetical protein
MPEWCLSRFFTTTIAGGCHTICRLPIGRFPLTTADNRATPHLGIKWPTPASLIHLVARNYALFILVPLVAGLAFAGAAGFLPKRFTSTAYLQIDEATARGADALMSSEPILDKVLTKISIPGQTLEERRRRLDNGRTIAVARNEAARTSRLFKLEVVNGSPNGARATNLAFIEAWLDASKPNRFKRDQIEGAIKRAEEQIKAASSIIDRLENSPPPDVTAEHSLQGNSATALVSLLSKRDQAYDNLTRLKIELAGLSRDAVLLGEPTLPEEPNGPKRIWAAAIGAAAGAVLLLAFLAFKRTRTS